MSADNSGLVERLREATEHYGQAAYLFQLAADALSAAAERERALREALQAAEDLPELNPSNYSDDDVCDLNAKVTEFVLAARTALGSKP